MSISEINLERINDYTYVFQDKKKRFVSLQLPKSHACEYNYNLAIKAAKKILESNKPSTKIRYHAASKNWKVYPVGKVSRFLIFISIIFDFVHRPGRDGIIRYKVDRAHFHCRKKSKKVQTKKELKIKHHLKKEFKNSEARFCFKNYIKESGRKVTKNAIADYKNELRASVSLSKSLLKFKTPFFEDPFTLLSKQAFVKLEKEFTSKDFFIPDHCNYRIIKRNNMLQLVHQNGQFDKKYAREAIELYKEFLIHNFGKEKIAYIEHLYRFKLDEIEALTPEHVYRINIGVTNLEYQDFDNFLAKLPKILADPTLKNTVPLKKYLSTNAYLSGREAKGLYQYLKRFTKHPTSKNLKDWLKVLEKLPSSSKELSPELFNELLPIIHFTDKEKENALTGRKIFGFIKSGYSNAQLGEYKPWVDQHQLTQFYPELIVNSSLTSYFEKLAHVVSKIHLAKEHPTEGFRVGSLIPAPPIHANGPIRWYKVTSCISNSYGIFSFTLESACHDPSLPGIKLFRSTASSSYALHSKATVVNDLNNFNSPGYQGIGRTDVYEEKFFKDRTIPLWVGYNELAKKEVKADRLDIARIYLKKAEEALLVEFNNKYPIKTLKEIIKTHDFLLNELELQLHPINGFIAMFGCAIISKKSSYARLFQQLVKSYILKTKIKNKIHIDERKDAERMVDALRGLHKLESSDLIRLKIRTLINDLERHILSKQALQAKSRARNEFNKTIFDSIHSQRIAIDKVLKSDKINAKGKLKALIENLDQHASACGESLESKTPGGIVMCGHSLGGACAQSHTVRWFTEKNRMPVPGADCSLYEYDSPAINKKSNQAFMNWGKQHQHLFRKSKVNFEIIRRQEAGDFIVTAGEEHLGAVCSEEEEKKASWLRFDAAVLKKHIHSKHFPICLPLTAHGTRFLEGKRVTTFYTYPQVLKLHKKWMAKKKSHKRTEALRQIEAILTRPKDYYCTFYTPFIQGIFNKEGKFKNKNRVERKEFERKFYMLKTNMWSLRHLVMNPRTAEEARKSVSLFWTIIRKLIVRGVDSYKLDSSYIDAMGNFAVGETGVLSQRKR